MLEPVKFSYVVIYKDVFFNFDNVFETIQTFEPSEICSEYLSKTIH